MKWLHRGAGVLARRLRAQRRLLSTPAPTRPVVIIESDDWGRVGIPSLAVLDELRQAGFPVDQSPWDRYGLESPDDVDQLAATLASFRDSDGNSARMTANFVMANADLRQMAVAGWQKFSWRAIEEGFPAPWNDKLMGSYRRAIAANILYPALHGFTHFNVPGLMAALSDSGDLGARARALAAKGVPYLRSLTPEFNFALVKCDTFGEQFLCEAEQAEWLNRGIKLFENAFGYRPISTCAPGYRANDVTYKLFSHAGIAVIQTAIDDIPFKHDGLLQLGRNVSFEPCLQAGDQVKRAVRQASKAVAAGAPIVICTHSINYITRFTGKAEFSRAELARLLGALAVKFPDLRFASDGEFYAAWQRCAEDWFREPTGMEKSERSLRLWRTGSRTTADAEEERETAELNADDARTRTTTNDGQTTSLRHQRPN